MSNKTIPQDQQKKELNFLTHIQFKITRIKLLALIPILLGLSTLYYFQARDKTNIHREIVRCPSCNIVLISIDDLRQKNMSLYGYDRKTTPNLDIFLQKSVVFTNAISVSTWTLPSHMSWFTGVYPSKHRILNKYTLLEDGEQEISNLKKLSPSLRTLAEILKEEGYVTGGFTGSAGVNRQFGYDQGFDTYYDKEDFAGFEDTVPQALNWITENKDKKLFIFLHGYDVHGQYIPSGGYDNRFVKSYKGKLTGSKEEQKQLTEEGISKGQIYLSKEDVEYLKDIYDEKIQRADEELATFFKKYEELGLQDKTIFIIASDHGEELYEHGRIDHGHSLYEELVRVPFVMKLPQLEEKFTIDQQIRSIDIMPTILDFVNAKKDVNAQFDGISLIPAMEGQNLNLDAFLETDYRYSSFIRALRKNDGWKIISNLESSEKSLFNLREDQREKENVISKEESKANLLSNELEKYLEKLNSQVPVRLQAN